MSLKKLVNNPEIWSSFLSYLEEEKNYLHKQMEQMEDPKDLYRLQGEIRRINKQKKLRDKVNNG